MVALYTQLLYRPILNLLIYLYDLLPGGDMIFPILLLTLFVKLVLFPFNQQTLKSQKSMQALQPKLEALKKEFGNDKEKLGAETMKLYRENKVNPFSSCLPLLIQFPFMIAVYQAFRSGLSSQNFDLLYPFVQNPGTINTLSLGFLDLAAPSTVLAIIAGLAQYVQTKTLFTQKPAAKTPGAKDENMLASMNTSMQYFMPLLTIVIGMQLPAGLTVYWFLMTVLTIAQQLIFNRAGKTPTPEIIPPPVANK